MFIYVFDKELNQWIEADNLYPHDVALLIDNKAKKIYLWFGDRSEKADREQGTHLAEDLMTKYKMYEFTILSDVVPLKVQAEIEDLLGERGDPKKNKIERTIPMRLFPKIGIIAIALMTLLFINNLRMYFWDTTNMVTQVNQWTFNDLFEVSAIIGLIAIGFFLIEFFLALASKKIFLVISALASLFIAVGAILYIGEGEFIFNFLEGAVEDYIYLIAVVDISIHIMWVLISVLGSAAPIIISIYQIRTTTEIKAKDLSKKKDTLSSVPSIVGYKRIGLKENQIVPPK
jgi:hypothetical protein